VIKAILMDCDGVLTDGTYLYTKKGKYMKRFSCIDSKGIKQGQKEGIYFAVISEDPSGYKVTQARCKDMGVDFYKAATAQHKAIIAENILNQMDIKFEKCAYIADDMGDVHILKKVGLPIATANAVVEIKELVKSRGGYITKIQGGKGAVREAIEWILKKNKE